MTGEYFPNIITGGCGFVGRNLTRRLLKDGKEVHIIDNLLIGQEPREFLWDREIRGTKRKKRKKIYKLDKGEIHFYNQDVREFFKKRRKIDVGDIFHLAALVGGRTTIEGEPLKVATDLSIDAEFFNWAIEVEPEKILYASSSAAYPNYLQNEKKVKLKEEHIDLESSTIGKPDMTYGWSKLTGEYLSRIAAKEYGLSVAVIRPFSGYGGDQDFDYPMPAITRRALRKEDPLTIWGSGKQVRDFIHINDCIEGTLLSIEKISDGSAVNLGTGKPTNFYEVAELLADIVGYSPEIKNLPNKPEGVKYRCADITKMKKVLGWQPKISLREGFRKTVNKVRERLKNKKK